MKYFPGDVVAKIGHNVEWLVVSATTKIVLLTPHYEDQVAELRKESVETFDESWYIVSASPLREEFRRASVGSSQLGVPLQHGDPRS